jgi:hypothetical protein
MDDEQMIDVENSHDFQFKTAIIKSDPRVTRTLTARFT